MVSRLRIGSDFFQATFYGLGALAKADGRVSEAEITAARMVMRELGLEPSAVNLAIGYFNEGKQPNFPLIEQVIQLRQACGRQAELLSTFLEIQMDFCWVSPPSVGPRALCCWPWQTHWAWDG